MSKARDREDFVALVAREGGTNDVARAIMRDAATYQRVKVAECNGEATERDQKRAIGCGTRIVKHAATFGARVKLGGDPRGYVVKLLLKSGRYNTMGGESEGYGVPA